jgi:hypothetical protein
VLKRVLVLKNWKVQPKNFITGLTKIQFCDEREQKDDNFYRVKKISTDFSIHKIKIKTLIQFLFPLFSHNQTKT